MRITNYEWQNYISDIHQWQQENPWNLLKVAYNYEERKQHVSIFTSALDTRYGTDKIKSRTGLEKNAVSVDDKFNFYLFIKNLDIKPNCILVDEAQFLTKSHILQLSDIVEPPEHSGDMLWSQD